MLENLKNLPKKLGKTGLLLESCPVAVLAVDAGGGLLYANAAFFDVLEPYEHGRAARLDQLGWVPLDEEGQPVRGAAVDARFLARHVEAGLTYSFFTTGPDDSQARYRLAVTVWPDDDQVFVLWFEPAGSPLDDETPRPVTEPTLHRVENHLSSLYSDLLRVDRLDDALGLVCRRLHTFLQCSTVFLLAASPDLKPAAVAGDWGPDFWEPMQTGLSENHPASWAFLGQKLVHIRDTQSMPELGRLRDWTRARGIGSMLLLPVSTGESRFGVLCLLHRQLFAFSAETTTRLEQLTMDLAVCWSNLQKAEGTEHCRRRFQQMQKITAFSRRFSREFTGRLEKRDGQWRWEWISPSCFDLLGLEEDRLEALPHGLFSMLAGKRELERALAELEGDQERESSWLFTDAQGTELAFRTNLAPRAADDGAPGWDVFCLDTTDLSLSRNASRRSEGLWKAVALLGQALVAPDFRDRLPDQLARIGQAAEVSRIYIFENHVSENGDLMTSQWMEWVAPGVPPQIDNPELQALSLAEAGFGRWVQELGQNHVVAGNVIDFPLAEQETLLPQSIVSMAVVPIFVNDRWWGFWGMDDCRARRVWTAPEVESLRTGAALLGQAISGQRARSESVWLEEQLQQSQRQESIGRLAHGIAHQFNNLLSPILGYVSVALLDLQADSPLASDLRQVHQAAERAKDLARNLLRLGVHHTYKLENVSARALLTAAVESLSAEFPGGVSLELESVSDRTVVRVDAEHFQQVLLAALRRAREALPEGAPRPIPVRAQLLRPAPGEGPYSGDEPRLQIDVAVRGESLSAAEARTIFEPFGSSSGSVTDLELSNAWNVVHAIGGTITWVPTPPSGNLIRVLLPLSDAEITASVELTPSPAPVEKAKEPATVLVVEDEDAVRHFVCRSLTKQGYRVLDAPDPQKAISIAHAHEGPIGLLITDVIMPHMSGKRLYQELKRTAPALKVLYMSGYTSNLLEKQGVATEERSFLAKPFGVSLLLKRVAEILEE